MPRKRLSAIAIEKLEQAIGDATADTATSAVFGICNMQKEVVRRLRMTADGVTDVSHEHCEADHLIPGRLEKLLYPKRFKFIFGGRGSGKTRTITTIITERARFKPDRIACFREIQQSIEDSSYQELVDEITRKGELKEFRVINNEITHRTTKAKFRFKGLYRNQTAVKGFAGITLGWVEEAENVSQVSWDILEPTIRAANSELWCSFNPNKESDPTWKNWIEPYRSQMEDGIYEDDEMLIIECNYSDNPWFTDTPLPASMERMKSTDYDRYLWIWEGKFNKRSDEQVFGGKWRTAKFEPESHWHGPYYGMDFGFSQDPVAMVETWIEMLPDDRRKVYVRREYGRVGLEITDTPAAMLQSFPDAKKHRWHGDSSRPEMISHIRRQGFDIQPCNKWPGSVEEGVMWLRGCDEIVIHDECVKVKEEMMNYSYKVDKLTGNVLTDIVDKWNHFMDAVRYSLNQHIVQRGAGWIRRKR